MSRLTVIPLLVAGLLVPPFNSETGYQTPDQVAQYQAEARKSIIELQQFRTSSSIRITASTQNQAIATLINLNPGVNTWFILEVSQNGRGASQNWHLENPNSGSRKLLLDPGFPAGIVVVEGNQRFPCHIFQPASRNSILSAAASQLIYYPLCDGRIYVRNPARGHRTGLESPVEFLRDQVWAGEKIIVLFHHLMADRYRETGTASASASGEAFPDRARRKARPPPRLSRSHLALY